jgi:DNA-binding GntR family transcriptional regulator
MPRAQRSSPLHRQIYDHIAAKIAAGEPGYRPGDKLPSIRETARSWGVAVQAAQQAYALLASARLTEARDRSATLVAQPRNVLGPQQRLRRASAGESVFVRAAELIPVPAYVRPILGLSPVVSHVIRREWVTGDSTGIFMLSVSWVPPHYASLAPELLRAGPLPGDVTAAVLLAGRGAGQLTWGRAAREARRVLDDDREARLLGLPANGCVLAETYVWEAGETALEYGEFIVRQGRVIQSEMEP